MTNYAKMDDFDKLIKIREWFKGFKQEQRENLIAELFHDYIDPDFTKRSKC